MQITSLHYLVTGPGCDKKLDIGFIIDRSGSIDENFDTQVIPFIRQVAKHFNISKDGVHAGVEVFSNPPVTKVVIDIGSETNTEDFIKAVNKKVVYPNNSGSHYTYINVAMKIANDKLFNYEPRKKVKRYALFITDGKQNTLPKYKAYDKYNAKEEASKLWKKKIDVLAVGVGKGINETALKILTDHGKHGKVIKVQDFGQLKTSMKAILSSICTSK